MSEYDDEIVYEDDAPMETYQYVVSVKLHNTNKAYTFGTNNSTIKDGDWLVVETVQGIELGECQSGAVSVDKYPNTLPLKPVLRIADEQDKQDYEDNFMYAEDALKVCEEEVKDLGLDMNLLSASYALDRSKVLFIYTADQRVDFRELLKRLSARLRCRIELRQIGDRDQAKMVGGIGLCGMECCCSRFKTRFDNISINMAKNQQLALNIEKLSGMCGKLMCCLKYENEVYEELTEGLPKLGAHIEYDGELYRVTSINVIANEARIENPDTYQTITVDDLREKAEIRKGVTIKRTSETSHQRRVMQKVIERETQEKHETPTITMEEPREVAHETTPNPRRKEASNNRRDNNHRYRNNNNQHRERRPEPENNGNVTVRTFKAKKETKSE